MNPLPDLYYLLGDTPSEIGTKTNRLTTYKKGVCCSPGA